MAHTVYSSFKAEDEAYKLVIQKTERLDCIDKSLMRRSTLMTRTTSCVASGATI